MKLCLYDNSIAGVVGPKGVHDIGGPLSEMRLVPENCTMVDVIEGLVQNEAVRQRIGEVVSSAEPKPLENVKLLAPIYNPSAIWAAFANYVAHTEEMKVRRGDQGEAATRASKSSKDELLSELFLKPPASIVGTGATVVLPKTSTWVDFECELCLVMGKRAKNLTRADALDHVFGFTTLWDISQREPKGSRCIRKGFDTFTPLGPWIVSKDEIPDPQNLSLRVWHNGKQEMNATTRDMICTIEDILVYLSAVTTLRPGDLVTTGTPAGVHRLADGDTLEGEIEGIGRTSLNVKTEV